MCLKLTGKNFLLLICLLICGSCKKDTAGSLSRTALLTSGTWKLTAVTFHGDWDGDGIIDPVDTDLYNQTDACTKDNLMIYHADGAGMYDEGADKCDGAPQTLSFSWSFYNPYTGNIDENVIKFDNLGFEALSIVELSTATLKVKNIVSGGFQLYTYSH